MLSVETAMTAEKVVTVKSDVVNVRVEKTATEMANTIVVEQPEWNVLSESAQADGTDICQQRGAVSLNCSRRPRLQRPRRKWTPSRFSG